MKNMLGDIFKDIISGCNKLISATLSRNENPKDAACNRLRLVLMHDRTKLDPATLERMRDELVEVISRYVEIDQELLDLNLASEGNAIALVASIPVIRAKQLVESSSDCAKEVDTPKFNLYDDDFDFDDEDIESVIIEEEVKVDTESNSESEESDLTDSASEEQNTEDSAEKKENLEDEKAEEKSDSDKEEQSQDLEQEESQIKEEKNSKKNKPKS